AAGTSGEPPATVLLRVAREHGQRAAANQAGAAVADILAGMGYEPHPQPARVVPANCPFHALAEDHHDLACGMNFALLEGLLDGLGADEWKAGPDLDSGRCCVTITTKED